MEKKKIIGNVPEYWSGLGTDLYLEIAGRLQSPEDYAAFRGVCTSWRAAASKNDFGAKSRSIPLLILPEKDESGDRELYSISSKRKLHKTLSLPEAKGKRWLEARFGWIVIVSESGEASLLNPLSNTSIKLPRYEPAKVFVRGAMLSANPSSSNFVLMMLLHCYLLSWRPGDASWKIVPEQPLKRLLCLGFCRDRFYTIDYSGNVRFLDPEKTNDVYNEARVITTLPHEFLREHYKQYLVGSSDGELILISRDSWYNNGTKRFKLFHIDVMRGDWNEIRGLDKDAVFIGTNTPFCVPAPPHNVLKPNHIYFTDDPFPFHNNIGDRGVYGIANRSIERFGIESFRPECHPLWLDSSNIFNV